MENKVGIQHTKEMLVLVLSVANLYSEAKKDGKIDLNDAGLLFTLFPKLGPAITDAGMIPDEFKNMDSAEAQELIAMIGTELKLDSPKAKIYVQGGLAMASKLYETYQAFAVMKAELDALEPAAPEAPVQA